MGLLIRLREQKRQQKTFLDVAKRRRVCLKKKLENAEEQLSEKLDTFIELLIDRSKSDESESS